MTMGMAAASVDPLPEVALQALRLPHPCRRRLAATTRTDNLDPDARAADDGLDQVDSLVVDPQHGLQPYSCGCIFRDPAVGALYKHDSPYTYFTSAELHLGEISLECSRAGASAVALWATQRLFPLERAGEFAANLGKCRFAALALHRSSAPTRAS
ncbi:MAG: hypothetical protein U0521_16575 [Anaerolineae bacterium]